MKTTKSILCDIFNNIKVKITSLDSDNRHFEINHDPAEEIFVKTKLSSEGLKVISSENGSTLIRTY